MSGSASSQILEVLEDAIQGASSALAQQRLQEIRERLQSPVRLAIAGRVKAGKSTLLNALIGEELAPTDAGECTQIVTWYVHGQSPRVRLFPVDGPVVERPYLRDKGALDIDLGGVSPEDVDHLEVSWPSNRLRETTLLDTPGIASISSHISARTEAVLTSAPESVPVADAVLYLLRHAHASDLRFLEAFESDEMLAGTSINTVGVLSRADEVGSCRLDAMMVARRVAERYERDHRIHRLCPTVLPVIGLVAHAAATLREGEYAALAAVARAEEYEVSQLLLSADRFAQRDSPVDVDTAVRTALLSRLGLFGVRLSVHLISSGACGTATELSRTLQDQCGIEELRGVLSRQFTERSRILRVRSAVAAVRLLLDSDVCEHSPALQARVEQVIASDRDLDEIRLWEAVRSGDVDLTPARSTELDRLLGGSGQDPMSRLGASSADPEILRRSAAEALERWQRLANHPLTPRPTQRAARTAIRTLEAISMTFAAGLSEPSGRPPTSL
ncbi:MAG: dynamin family protein [Ornithinimicrobium sp.]